MKAKLSDNSCVRKILVMKRNYTSIILFLFIFLIPLVGSACPMCQGGPTKDTILAYKGITLFLALLPILGGGGIFYWIYLRSKNIKESNP